VIYEKILKGEKEKLEDINTNSFILENEKKIKKQESGCQC